MIREQDGSKLLNTGFQFTVGRRSRLQKNRGSFFQPPSSSAGDETLSSVLQKKRKEVNTPWFWHKERRQHVNVWYAHFARDKSRCNEMSCNCCARDKGEKEVEEGKKKVERSLWNENENEEMIKGRECNKRGETILLKRFLTIEIGWAILFFFFFYAKVYIKI